MVEIVVLLYVHLNAAQNAFILWALGQVHGKKSVVLGFQTGTLADRDSCHIH